MTVTVPAYSDLLWPTLPAAIALGGSASIAELDAAVIEREQLAPEQQSVLLRGGPQTVVQNRLAWARTYLKGMGLLTNSKRGIWAVTQEGQAATKESIEPLRSEFAAARKKTSKNARAEAKRDGAPPVDLIDGNRLCKLLKDNAIGVTTAQRTVEDVKVERDFFASLEPK